VGRFMSLGRVWMCIAGPASRRRLRFIRILRFLMRIMGAMLPSSGLRENGRRHIPECGAYLGCVLLAEVVFVAGTVDSGDRDADPFVREAVRRDACLRGAAPVVASYLSHPCILPERDHARSF